MILSTWLGGFFALHFLSVSILEFLLLLFKGGISRLCVLISPSLDLIKSHTDDSLRNSGGFSSSLLEDIFNSNFLVISSPGLGPCKLNWLDFLMVHASGLGANKHMGFTVFSNEFATLTWVDFHV